MSGTQISTSVTIINSQLGYQAISLSEMDSSAATVITAGSKVEIASAFFNFGANETPQASTWTSISVSSRASALTAYVTLLPSGTAGSQIVTARWATDVPTWSDSKQGWYDPTTGSVIRYVGGVIKAGATTYENKFIIDNNQRGAWSTLSYSTGGTVTRVIETSMIYEIGSWDMVAAPSGINVSAHSIISGQITGINAIIIGDDGKHYNHPSPSHSHTSGGDQLWYDPATDLITISCFDGGVFDSSNFNDTNVNRGWIIVRMVDR